MPVRPLELAVAHLAAVKGGEGTITARDFRDWPLRAQITNPPSGLAHHAGEVPGLEDRRAGE